MKTCCKCFAQKPLNKFFKCKAKKDGLASACKLCSNATVAEWKKANPNRSKQHNKKYYENNFEKIAARASAYKRANPEKRKQENKKWRINNPERWSAIHNRRYLELHDEYVKKLIRGKTIGCDTEIPNDLVEAKRAYLKILRIVKRKTDENA